MKQRISIFFQYYLFWLLLFILQKPLFMVFNVADTSVADYFAVMWHGLPLDLSVAAYITVVFGLLLVVSVFARNQQTIRKIIDVYTGVILAIAIMGFVSDIGLYPAWQFRLDKTVFIYLASPKNVLACAEWWVWVVALLAFVVCSVAMFIAYRNLFSKKIENLPQANPYVAIVLFLLTGCLFLPIRGSISVSTLNTGRVYFSQNLQLNHAAINPIFNLIESLGEKTFDAEKYTYLPSEEAKTLVDSLLDGCSTQSKQYFTTTRPNIFLVIVESLSANAVETLGGEPNVTPCFNKLCEEGILFANCYSSSFRTDRGIVATLSGFPGQPTSSLMLVPSKSARLPFISRDLQKVGYNLKFYYGGDEDFTNMRSYLTAAGFEQRLCDKDFPLSDRLSKWGAHDHVLFNRVIDEYAAVPQPFFQTILTLSSHEPFEVPSQKRFDDIYLNSIAYTDSCIGAFVEHVRGSELWNNSVIVFVADHGFPYPAGTTNEQPERYRIPILMVGGAVKQPCVVENVCSQIDLAPTLLSQLGLNTDNYLFGKNVLCDDYAHPFAFFSFVDGFGMVMESDTVVFDAKSRIFVQNTDSTPHTAYSSQAYMQRIYEVIDSL